MTTPDPTTRGRYDAPRLARVQAAHHKLLARWRGAMDLVGPGPLEPHFEDSESAIAGLEAAGPWADLGSGAGFPGVALAGAYPDATVELVESRRKRSTFLEKVVFEAGLDNATVCNVRSESLPDSAYAGIISRAYRPPHLVLEDAARLLVSGGRVVLLLGSQAEPDIPPGWAELDRTTYPVADGQRMRLVLEHRS